MIVVVDAAVVVDALIGAPGSDQIAGTLSRGDLHAPHLLDYEVTSALRGLVLGGALSTDRAMDALSDFDDLAITRWTAPAEQRRAMFALRENLSIYDASYVALAQTLECTLVTRDPRLGRAGVGGVSIEVV